MPGKFRVWAYPIRLPSVAWLDIHYSPLSKLAAPMFLTTLSGRSKFDWLTVAILLDVDRQFALSGLPAMFATTSARIPLCWDGDTCGAYAAAIEACRIFLGCYYSSLGVGMLQGGGIALLPSQGT